MIGSNQFVQLKKPNRETSNKDEKYHSDYGKWAASSINSSAYLHFLEKCYVNWCFYKGRQYQWIYEEDMAGFFLDETGSPRHRIRISHNLIKPMVNYFVGNSIRTEFKSRAESRNDLVKNKIDQLVEKFSSLHDIIEDIPQLEEVIRSQVPLGENKDETERLIRMSSIDEVTDAMNSLISILSERVNDEEIKVRGARSLALYGMAVYYGVSRNLQYTGKRIDSYLYFWDTNARESNLQDAAFMGHIEYSDVPQIAEYYQNLTSEELKTLEAHASAVAGHPTRLISQKMNNQTGNTVMVVHSYWKDYAKYLYGWVRDDAGYISLERIEKDDKYSKKDLVKKSELNDDQLAITGGDTSKYVIVEEIRYCIFTPGESLGGGVNTGGKDIVYEYGVLEDQEDDPVYPESSRYPYKVSTWAYENGEVLTPLDDAIDPQRMINRLFSISESQFNNAHGSGTIVAADAIDDEEGDVGLSAKMKRGDVITVDARKYNSVHNAISEYKSNMGDAPQQIAGFISMVQQAFREMTAVNDSMTGSTGTSNALVGVVQEQINQGTLVQEPFFYALASYMNQIYQNMAHVGRKVYSKYPKMLSLFAGDRARSIVQNIEDMSLESWRVFIKRAEPESTEVQKADNLIFMLLQYQMIDANLASKLLGRSTTDLVYDQVRKYQGKLAQAQEEQAQQEQEILAAQAEAEELDRQQQMEMSRQESDRDQYNKDADRMVDYVKSQERNENSLERDLLKLSAQ
jgi:hypothetical protein